MLKQGASISLAPITGTNVCFVRCNYPSQMCFSFLERKSHLIELFMNPE